MPSETVLLEVDDAVATLTLNRPDKLNAVDPALLEALVDAAERIEDDAEIRAVVLTGAGGRSFCVGGDVDAWGGLDAVEMWRRWIPAGRSTSGAATQTVPTTRSRWPSAVCTSRRPSSGTSNIPF